MVKIDFHIHTSEDIDNNIAYSAFDLIDRAAHLKFDAITITNHNAITFNKDLENYAKSKGLILFPGFEQSIDHKHVLLINFSKPETIETFSDIAQLKTDDNLVIAPHPFFPGMQSLGKDIYSFPKLFDAVEFCHFYCPQVNFNREAIRFSQKNNLPMIAGSDAHVWEQFGRCYSLVKSEKNKTDIIKAIKAGKVISVAPALTLAKMISIYIKILKNKPSLKRSFVRIHGIINRLKNVSETRNILK
ncbi:phosphoesterase [Candidatus Magnetomorum sp. HK-1]|nr:phosphoesterase [Candidatus Magnetomorum sp. HK-1]